MIDGDDWSFFNPTRIVFRPGLLDSLGAHIPEKRVALVTTPGFTERGLTSKIQAMLGGRLVHICDDVSPNPDIDHLDEQILVIREARPEAILALGGGSSIDSGKAISRVLASGDEATLAGHLRFKERLSSERLRLIAVPTTSGTGAEVTSFATMWDRKDGLKRSLEGAFPDIALLDPRLTHGLPYDLTLFTGLDAISHALESVWNKNMSPISYLMSLRSLSLSLHSLPELVVRGENSLHRRRMMEASLWAGMAISQTRTSISHALSYSMTLSKDMPHGLACGFTLPSILKFNSREDDGRLEKLAKDLGYADLDAFTHAIDRIFTQMGVREQVSRFIESAGEFVGKGNSDGTMRMGNNMRAVEAADIDDIIIESLK